MQNFIGAVFTQLYGFAADGTPLPMIVIAVSCGLLTLMAGATPFWLKRRRMAGAA
jgi:hypothetical protein